MHKHERYDSDNFAIFAYCTKDLFVVTWQSCLMLTPSLYRVQGQPSRTVYHSIGSPVQESYNFLRSNVCSVGLRSVSILLTSAWVSELACTPPLPNCNRIALSIKQCMRYINIQITVSFLKQQTMSSSTSPEYFYDRTSVIVCSFNLTPISRMKPISDRWDFLCIQTFQLGQATYVSFVHLLLWCSAECRPWRTLLMSVRRLVYWWCGES